jgi:peptide/nickel transport system substrate-binding protein
VNRRDRAAVVALLSALAIIVALVALPSFESPAAIATPSPSPSGPPVAAYREGVVGRSSSITPLTARGPADRELVALIFSGLVRLGPGGDVLPDLAESWDVDKTGARYTFRLRPDAVWQDGEPVTASDVAFTVNMLQDPGYTGPEETSWREVSVKVLDDRTVQFDLATPLGGFLQAATQPLLPEHLLRDVAAADLADSPFSQAPVGSGPFELVAIDGLHAELVPASPPVTVADPGPTTGVDSLATAPPPPPPSRPTPYLDAVEIHFFNDAASLATAYRAGRLDAAVGLPPTSASALAALEGSRLLRYPSTTLTAVYMNQRGKSAFRDVRVRRALSALIDRDGLVETVLAGQGTRADSLIPPNSWAFDAKASKPVAFDRKAATTLLKKAGWRKLKSGWAAPGRTKPLVLTVIAPDQMSNAVTYDAARQIAKAWSSFGFKVDLEGLPAAEFTKRLQAGTFSLAVADVNVGLDPDLYPLLASTQATTSGLNISGIQSLVLDNKLSAARKPGSTAARTKAYAALQTFLAQVQVVLPVYVRDEPIVLSDEVIGPAVRELGDAGDRFWDVLTWRLANDR